MAGQERRPPAWDQQDLPVTPSGVESETDTGPEPARDRQRRGAHILGTTRRRLAAALAALATLLGITTALLDVNDAVFHDDARSASVTVAPISQPNVPVARYAETHPGWFRGSANPESLGAVYTVAVSANRLKDQRVTLAWQPSDALNRQPVPEPRWAPMSMTLRPSRDAWHDEIQVWVAYPAVEYLTVKFSIEAEGDVLDSATSMKRRLGGGSP